MALYSWDALAENATVDSQGAGFRGVTLAHAISSKKQVNLVLNQAVEAGATLVKAAQDVFWGGFSGYFSDLRWAFMGSEVESAERVQCCPEIIPALYVQSKIRYITKYFSKHQSRVHRDRPFVAADFVDRSVADAHRFGQLPLKKILLMGGERKPAFV